MSVSGGRGGCPGALLVRPLQPQQLRPPWPAAAVDGDVRRVQLVAQGRRGPRLRRLTQRQDAALGEELVRGHHGPAAGRRELEVRVRAAWRARRRRRLQREVAGEGHPRWRHQLLGRRRRWRLLPVVHVNTCVPSNTPADDEDQITRPKTSCPVLLLLLDALVCWSLEKIV